MANEFLVNTLEEGWQDDPLVQSFADGSFVILWRSIDLDTSTYFVASQRYDKFGRRIGSEQVLDYIEGDASEISGVTRLKDGGIVIVFAYSPGGLLEPDEVYAKIYNADFSVRKNAFRVDTVPDSQSVKATVGALSNGGFIIFYDSQDPRPTQTDIYAQRYDSSGNKIGSNFQVNSRVHEFDQDSVSVIELKNGNLLAIWHSEASLPDGDNSDSNEIRGTIFGKNGQIVRADFSIADAEGGAGSGTSAFEAVELNNGGFALVRTETEHPAYMVYTYDVKLRLFDSTGKATTREITVSKPKELIYDVNVAQLVTGEIVVVWQSPSPVDHTYDDVLGRVYDASGRALSGIFQIAEDTYLEQTDPDIEALPGGGFVVTYMSEAIDNDDDGVAARIFGRGTAGADVAAVDGSGIYFGFGGNDTISGNAYGNRLNGGDGNDKLVGKAGNDRLSGGSGSDRFYFTAGLNAKTNVDTISDFASAVDDIVLSDAIFKSIGANLSSSEFRIGKTALDENDHVIYDKGTGKVYYDANGAGSGGQSQFAALKPGTALTYSDFDVI